MNHDDVRSHADTASDREREQRNDTKREQFNRPQTNLQ